MRVVTTRAEGLRHVLRIAVPAQEIHVRVEERLSEMSRRIRLPGFRPGKVPIAVVRERYGATVTREIVERAVTESSEHALRAQGLRPALVPAVEIVSPVEGGDLEFCLTVDVLPDIPAVDVGALEVEELTAEVTEDDVDQWLEPGPARSGAEAEAASLDTRRQAAREHLERKVARLARTRLRRQLFDRLAEAHDFPVPHGLVDREFAAIWETVQATRRSEAGEIASTGERETSLRAEFRAIAERRVRLGLLLAEIARRYGIEPGGDRALLENRVVDFVAERARVVKRIVPLDDLVRQVDG